MYLLEEPQWGTSNEYPQHMFNVEIRKYYPRIIIKYFFWRQGKINYQILIQILEKKMEWAYGFYFLFLGHPVKR